MPGFSLFFSKDRIESESERRLTSAAESLELFPEYDVRELHRDNHLRLFFSGYPEYPLIVIERKRYRVYLEGRIYDRDDGDIVDLLEKIAEYGLSENCSQEEFSSFLQNNITHVDGDFNITVIDTVNGNFLILNDSFGKLLMYHYADSGRIVISREVKFIQRAIGITDIDRYGAAELLMFKKTIGGRTLLRDVHRFPHASFVRCHDDFNPQSVSYHQWDTSETDFCKSIDKNAEHLVDLFLTATANRERSKAQPVSIIGLSGGMDSRAVLSGLERAKADFVAVSTVAPSKTNLRDVEIAGKLAALYNTEFLNWVLDKPSETDYRKLVECLDGLNGCEMAVAFQLYRKTLPRFGWGANFHTGDGGARIKTPYRLHKKFSSTSDMVDYALLRISHFSNEDVEQLLGIGQNELIKIFNGNFAGYPGDNLQDQYNNFTIFDHRAGFVFEGEERTRLFYWTVAPFESQPFYSYAMRLPDKYKVRMRLAVKFLDKLDSRLLDIENADYRGRPDSFRVRFILSLKQFLQNHQSLYKIVSSLRNRNINPPAKSTQTDTRLLDIAKTSKYLDHNLNVDRIDEMLNREELKPKQRTGLASLIYYINSLSD